MTHDQAKALAKTFEMALLAQTANREPVVADAGSLNRFDSSALAVLLACRRQAYHPVCVNWPAFTALLSSFQTPLEWPSRGIGA